MSSEPAEVQEALKKVSQALAPFNEHKTVTWITDRGFDDVAVWRTIWEQNEHVVCRIYHFERTVALQRSQGQGVQGDLAQAQEQVRRLARVETTMEVQRGKQSHRHSATSGSGNCGLSRSLDLFDKRATKGTRAESHQDALVGESERALDYTGTLVVAHGLAC